jgi:uncharacterized membrane protein
MAQVERAIIVQAAADTVYQVWRNFENFPNFMANIEEVRDMGEGRYHWRAKGPLGSTAEWDAEITQDEPGKIIAWRSIETEDDNVRTAGAVEFESLGDATRITVTIDYEAPAGALGERIAKIFANPSNQVEQDLQRFKESVESNAGYNERSTHSIIGSGADASEPEAPAGYSQTVGKRPHPTPPEGLPVGPGMAQETGDPQRRANDEPGGTSVPRPMTTGTPGGTLGAPTEAELKADPEAVSEKEAPLHDGNQR